jgi:hypothetical protein
MLRTRQAHHICVTGQSSGIGLCSFTSLAWPSSMTKARLAAIRAAVRMKALLSFERTAYDALWNDQFLAQCDSEVDCSAVVAAS